MTRDDQRGSRACRKREKLKLNKVNTAPQSASALA